MGQHGGSIIGEHLAAHGVSHLFTLCGGHISPILTGAQENGVRVVDVRDEVSAVFAADAIARMTGIPGVAAVTAGPGVTNTITAIKNAQMAETPLLLLGGATATILKGRGSLQDIDQMSLMRTVTKWAASAKTVPSLGALIDQALKIATSGVPGPVFLEVPVDLLYPEETVSEWYLVESGAARAKGPAGAAMRLGLQAYLARVFRTPHLPLHALPGTSDVTDLLRSPLAVRATNQAAEALRGAKKPVLVIGAQALATMTPFEAEQLAGAVRALGVPTFLGGTARGLLGRHASIQFRHKRSRALKDADVVIVAGFPFDFRMGYGRKINKRATLISANLDPSALKKNRRPDIAVQTHPGRFLIDLASRANPRPDAWTGWFDELPQPA